jgi:hypothetical protein
VVVSAAVWRSLSALNSAPSSTAKAERNSQRSRMITAARAP